MYIGGSCWTLDPRGSVEKYIVYYTNLPGALCGSTATTSPVVLLYRVQILILQILIKSG